MGMREAPVKLPALDEPVYRNRENKVQLVDETGVVYEGTIFIDQFGNPDIPSPNSVRADRQDLLNEGHLRWMGSDLRKAVMSRRFGYRQVYAAVTAHLMSRTHLQ